jgi:hypothetical protein
LKSDDWKTELALSGEWILRPIGGELGKESGSLAICSLWNGCRKVAWSRALGVSVLDSATLSFPKKGKYFVYLNTNAHTSIYNKKLTTQVLNHC